MKLIIINFLYLIMQAINNKTYDTRSLFSVLKCIEYEAVIWLGGLILLALSNPLSDEHFTLFLPDLLFGIKSPGFNLGHSIAHFFNFDIINSFNAHPLGIPAVLILGYRILVLTKKTISNINKLGS